MVEDGAVSYKIDYITIGEEIVNFEGHQTTISGAKVMAILLNKGILPIGGASAVEGLLSTGLPHFFFFNFYILHISYVKF